MATNATWTVIFEDKLIIKNTGAEAGTSYIIDDSSFWSNASFSNLWAIQSGTANSSDEVEHKDSTPHASLAEKGIDIQLFINKWDAAHLAQLQKDWDDATIITYTDDTTNLTVASTESDSDKTARLGPRPTSYSS